MLTLYSRARITNSEAEVLHQAVDILIDANAKARHWPKKATGLRRLFEHTKVRVHTIEEGE